MKKERSHLEYDAENHIAEAYDLLSKRVVELNQRVKYDGSIFVGAVLLLRQVQFLASDSDEEAPVGVSVERFYMEAILHGLLRLIEEVSDLTKAARENLSEGGGDE